MRVRLAVLALLAVVLTACSADVSPDEASTGDPAIDEVSPEPDPVPDPAPAPDARPAPDEGAPDDGASDDQDDGSIRAVWVHLFDDTLKSEASIRGLVDEVVAAGANTIIAQVARRHDAYYTSAVLPETADPGLDQGVDVLDTLLRATAATDLQVHAWISVAPTWHATYEDLPSPPGWLPGEHGQRAPEPDRWVTRTVDGVWTEYLDIALPQVVDHVVDVSVELVESYPIDGIHLDYVRYEAADRGYHPDALTRFASETGGSTSPAPEDAVWSDWRREQSRNLMSRVREALDATGTGAQLSAPVITWGAPPEGPTLEGTRAYRDALQAWDRWAREGIVDVLFPMNYFRAHDAEQAGWFDGWVAYQQELGAETGTHVGVGVGGWLNQPDAVVDQVHTAMAATGVVAVYSYQQPADGDRREVFDRLAATHWGGDPTG